jgi:peptide/nickel transport system substrate-binding protein
MRLTFGRIGESCNKHVKPGNGLEGGNVRKHVTLGVIAALVAALALAASGYGSNKSAGSSAAANRPTSAKKGPFEGPLSIGTPKRGGTYTEGWDTSFSFTDNFDPTGEYLGDAWGVMTNLLVRTLVSYRHTEGAAGNVPVPDLATALPRPTNGGKTWTFHLKSGIKFGPPLNREITSKDIAYALARLANPKNGGQYAFYYTAIKGWDAVANGKATTISGIQTPNDKTIVLNLTRRQGDFLFRMSMPATGPIPEEVAKCFDGKPGNYGRDVVSSGPYMFAGSGDVKAGSCPIQPMSGYNGSTTMSFVRNPNYSQSTDKWRKNYPDKFELVVNANPTDIVNRVQNGSYDGSNLQPPPNVLQQYATKSSLHNQLHVNPGDRTWYLSMNLTQAPFDDIHVRKAMNFAMDKISMRKAWGGPLAGQIATHIVPPTMIPNTTLSEYDPYSTPGGRGDAKKAQAEMKLSKYDKNHDGKCDASACKNLLMIADTIHQYTAMVPTIQAGASKIGITLKVRTVAHAYPVIQTTSNNIPFEDRSGWGKDYPDPLTFFNALFTSAALIPQGNTNYALVGITPAINKAKKLGVKGNLKNVPNVDSRFDLCNPPIGSPRKHCWESLDKYLMEKVVPWVPYLWQTPDRITGPTVTHWDWDQFSTTTAYSQVAVK